PAFHSGESKQRSRKRRRDRKNCAVMVRDKLPNARFPIIQRAIYRIRRNGLAVEDHGLRLSIADRVPWQYENFLPRNVMPAGAVHLDHALLNLYGIEICDEQSAVGRFRRNL